MVVKEGRKKEEGRRKKEEGRRKREEGRREEDRSPDRQISTFAIGRHRSQSRPNPFSTSAKFPAN